MNKLNRIGLLVLLLITVGVVACGASSASEAPAAADGTPRPTRPPKATRRPTRTPLPVSPSDALKAEIDELLGESDRGENGRKLTRLADDGRTLTVEWAAGDNLTVGMAMAVIEREAADILRLVDESDVGDGTVRLVVTFPLKDDYGNVKESQVVSADYSRETLGRINWGGLSPSSVFTIADSAVLHPDLR